MEIGEGEAVLEPMSGEKRGDAVNVAETEDKSDDGLRGDGIETGGGRIVENDGRTSDEGTGDGDAAAHTAGEFGGNEIDGVFELDETENFANVWLDFIGIGVVFEKTIGDVVGDGHRIEERTFLEDKADFAAKVEEFTFGHGADIFSEDFY